MVSAQLQIPSVILVDRLVTLFVIGVARARLRHVTTGIGGNTHPLGVGKIEEIYTHPDAGYVMEANQEPEPEFANVSPRI